MKPLTPLAISLATTLLAISAFAHAGGYVQHVTGDVSDSRQNFPLRVARGETVDVSIDFFDDRKPLDITGSPFVSLECKTNGMAEAESFAVPGVATNGNSALFRVKVDDFCPEASGTWTCVVSNEWATLARVGGSVFVRGTAAASSHALPKSALSGYATTNYVADAIAEIDVDETDPVWGREKTDYLPVSGGTVTGTLEVLDETLEGAGASVKASDGSNDTYYRWWGIERRQFGDSLSSLTFPGSGRGEIALLGPYGSAYSKSQTDSAIAGAAGASTNYTDSSVATRATPEGVTNIVRDLSLGGIWDEQLQVWWAPRMRNGSLTYEATTNVNLNAGN